MFAILSPTSTDINNSHHIYSKVKKSVLLLMKSFLKTTYLMSFVEVCSYLFFLTIEKMYFNYRSHTNSLSLIQSSFNFFYNPLISQIHSFSLSFIAESFSLVLSIIIIYYLNPKCKCDGI